MTTPKKTLPPSKDLLKQAIDFVRQGNGLDDQISKVAGLELPNNEAGKTRAAQVHHIIDIIEDYLKQDETEQPLSVVVFGPPGSGKSTFVRMIRQKVDEIRKEKNESGLSTEKTANLTQIAGTEELAQLFDTAPLTKDSDAPVYFFDEFDAALEGVPLGWLRWFLAPMQDGVVLKNGEEVPIRKAIFFFAGGTAETLEEFNRRAQLDQEAYRARKVPDFVSRLRGAIDIGGVNSLGDDRIVSRALVLRRLLKDRQGELDDDRIGQLLSAGHFVHGVRSMKTLLDARWTEDEGIDLPDSIGRQHYSLGNLDGQLVGISAGLEEKGSAPLFTALTKQLLREGATIAYAGAFTPDGTLEQVLTAESKAPAALGKWDKNRQRVWNYQGYPASLMPNEWRDNADKKAVGFLDIKTLSAGELEELAAPAKEYFTAMPDRETETYTPRWHIAWALSLFRLRVRVIQDICALVVVGGKNNGESWGRMAGIAEEVMIALALKKPVYVLGGAGGAAQSVGQLLGMGDAPVGLQRCLAEVAVPGFDKALKPFAQNFEIPGVPDSPKTLDQVRRLLFHCGVTTADWPWNGLDLVENRTLFSYPISDGTQQVEEAVGMILQGLSRIDWKRVG